MLRLSQATSAVCVKTAETIPLGIILFPNVVTKTIFISASPDHLSLLKTDFLYLLRQGGAGELHCPSLYPIEAIFTEFKYDSSATLGKIEYEFEFTQVCDDKKEIAPLDYIVAYDGDNAFDIAARANMSVDEIMQLNDMTDERIFRLHRLRKKCPFL